MAAAAEAEFEPLDEQQMDEELDRIEAEFDALDGAGGNDAQAAADLAADHAKAPEEGTKSSVEDSADMLDEEETFPARSAIEAMADRKLEQVAALRNTGADDEARRLLYEVLSEGNETQVRVARNILEQLDD